MPIALSDTQAWQALDAAHHWHPFTDTKMLAKEGTRVIVRAEGSTLWDSDGNEILDGMAGLWCVNVGYGRRELADAARQQMLDLPYYNTFFRTTTPQATELAAKLAEITPAGLDRVLFANSGSEANDTIVRMTRHYWNLAGQPTKKIIISREFAYHGSTMASVSLGGMAAMHRQGNLPLPGFEYIRPPYTYRDCGNMTPAEFGIAAAKALEERILAFGADRIAAFIAEPIQGAGGVLVPPETYFPEIQRICRQYDVLLICDEVICGFGRTGQWFGSDTFGIQPDFMTLAKGLSSGYMPISAVMVGSRVADLLIEEGGEFYHGFTYSGHPVAARVALENIRIIEEEGLVARAGEDIGPYLQAGLRSVSDHPLVGEVRGVGMIGAFELVRDKDGPVFFEPDGVTGSICCTRSLENGLMMRAVRDTMVLSPPLVITHGEVDQLIEKARRALDLTQKDLDL